MIEDIDLANEIITRLNELIEDPDVAKDISAIIENRIVVSNATMEHPTIQVQGEKLGFLGLLNGILGTIHTGKYQGYGYITASYDEDGIITKFSNTMDKLIK